MKFTRRKWFAVTVSIAIVVIMLGAMLASTGAIAISAGTPAPPPTVPPKLTFSTIHPDSNGSLFPTVPLPQGLSCALSFAGFVPMIIFGPGCFQSPAPNYAAINTANAQIAATNVITNLYNSLNITSSEVANMNATFQELLSYYEARAEAIAPYFLNSTWNTSVYDQIAIDSGLVPSLIGVETSFALQQYQDWNATKSGWDFAFGNGGNFASTSAEFGAVTTLSGAPTPSNVTESLARNGQDINVSRPFEFWTSTPLNGYGSNTTYFSLASGGTLLQANVFNSTAFSDFANYTIYDLTQNFSFPMPRVNYTNFYANNYPIVSTLHHISQFDLLKVVCSTGCAGAGGPNNPVYTTFETSGAYMLAKSAPPAYNFFNTGVPTLLVSTAYVAQSGFMPSGRTVVPDSGTYVCVTLSPSSTSKGPCNTAVVPTGGNATALGSGPGAVAGGSGALTGFASTAQSLVNNTMKMAYDYWLTLRAITDSGHYPIPANCAIPTPSDAFPTTTNFQNYNLSVNNVEAVYLSYLNAVAREYGQVFTNSIGFCGDPNLGFSFNWTSSWKLLLNITASIYISGGATPLYLNGTPAPNVSYSDVASWPVYNVDPSLLYPDEYQMNVPVHTIYPIPVNDPLSAVLVNYPANLEFGNPALKPSWGVPTYASLYGNGNYIGVSGNLTKISTGRANNTADAIEINSCVYEGISQNSCDISVTYFNNFTIGLVHAILPPVPIPPSGLNPFSGGGAACGTSVFTSWYDAWGGYIVSGVASVFIYVGNGAASIPYLGSYISGFFTALGCVLGWIALILVVIVIMWIAFKVVVLLFELRAKRR